MRTLDQLELCVLPNTYCSSMARSFRFLSGKVMGYAMVWQNRRITGFASIPIGSNAISVTYKLYELQQAT